MQIRDQDAYDRWWKDADFPARKIAILNAQQWARKMEQKIKADGGMITLEVGALRSTDDPCAFRDAVFFLMDCWDYGIELERQVLSNPKIKLNYPSHD